MMGILDQLDKPEVWHEFLKNKKEGGHLCAAEEARLRAFIDLERYRPVVERIRAKEKFPCPNLLELNKQHSQKKRKVFVFDEGENTVLKLIAYLLGKYDHLFCGNLYSFRRNIGVKNAIADILRDRRLAEYYTYKADIHDYFNSADTERAVALMKSALSDDPALAEFLEGILREPYCLREGEPTVEKKGIMAGVPVSGFLANLYLNELDRLFEERGALYARYSDDIIVFADSAENIEEYEKEIKNTVTRAGLEINTRKELRTTPGQAWEFLGYCVHGRTVDIGRASLDKIKAKFRRKARALAKWKSRKGVSAERAVRAFIKFINRKLYDNPVHNEITWCRWYFPTVTTAESLRVLDEYAVQCIRYIATGKHAKTNYRLRYQTIKSYGYQNPVHSFYEYKKRAKGNL